MKKTLAIILTAIILVSALSLAASASAKSFMNWKTYGDNDDHDDDRQTGNSHKLATQQSFARLDGIITKWGSTNVTGTIEAQSRTVVINSTSARQGASATAIWTTNQSRPLSALKAKENFTYAFYTAKLVNASTASLNMTGYSYFLNGTWNVYQVTTNFTITTNSAGDITSFNHNQNAVALATNAYGELKVSSSGSNFTLAINGVNPLTGSVHVQRITTKMFNPFKVNNDDNNDDNANIVTKADVSTVVSSYGSSPGWGKYDQRMDYNFNYKIDITDLTTAAANVNA